MNDGGRHKIKVGVTARGWGADGAHNPAQALDAGRRAEAAGLDGVHTGDHVTFYGKGTDGLLTLAAPITGRAAMRPTRPAVGRAAGLRGGSGWRGPK